MEVEHLLPHKGGMFPERNYDWDNLFLSRVQRNKVKNQRKYEGDIWLAVKRILLGIWPTGLRRLLLMRLLWKGVMKQLSEPLNWLPRYLAPTQQQCAHIAAKQNSAHCSWKWIAFTGYCESTRRTIDLLTTKDCIPYSGRNRGLPLLRGITSMKIRTGAQIWQNCCRHLLCFWLFILLWLRVFLLDKANDNIYIENPGTHMHGAGSYRSIYTGYACADALDRKTSGTGICFLSVWGDWSYFQWEEVSLKNLYR